MYGKIRILQRTGKASPDRPLRFSEVKRAKRKGEGAGTVIEPIVKEQILVVRDTGETNMFDVTAVTKIALKMGFLELAEYLQNHKSEYCHFIIWGKTSEQEHQKKEDIPKQDRQKNR